MRRREIITLLGGAAAAWPVAVQAQQPALPVIGFLSDQSFYGFADMLAAFQEGLRQLGFVDGQNVAIEYRWADGQNDRLPELAADLVRRRVAVIAIPGAGTTAALAAKAVTTTIPIVIRASDPVQSGLVASLNRPGGKLTGVSALNVELGGKRLGLLHELIPGAVRIAVLVNPNSSVIAEPFIQDVQAAAATIGQQIEVLTASTNREIDAVFVSLVQRRADALLVSPDNLFNNRRLQIAGLSIRHRVPAIYTSREFAEAGGLMSYGASATDQSRQVGIHTGRILMGEKPADLPVLRPTKFEFLINLHTAKLLGLDVPPTLLAIADEVIE